MKGSERGLMLLIFCVSIVVLCLGCCRKCCVEDFTSQSVIVTTGSIAPGYSVNNGSVTFTFGMDSNMSVSIAHSTLWSSNTAGKNAANLVVQADGNMVMYSADGPAVWSTGTNGVGDGPYSLQLVVSNATTGHLQLKDSTDKVIWQDVSSELQASEDLLEIAERFAPVIQLDSREPFRPIGIRDFIQNSTQQLISGVPCLTYNGNLGPPSQLDMQAKISYKATEINVGGSAYYSILYICGWTKDDGYFEYLGGIPVVKRWSHVGGHAGDLEHIRVIIDKKTMTIARAFFGSHYPSDGSWLFPDDCLYFDAQREHIMAFAALGNHGIYPSPGVYVRAGLIISDSNDGKGLQWNTKPSESVEPYPTEILNMTVKFGSPKIQLPHNQWFWRADDPKSSTAWMRLIHSTGFVDPAADLTLNRNQVQDKMKHIRRAEAVKWSAIILIPFILSGLGFAAVTVTPWAWFAAAPLLGFWIFVIVLILTTGAFWLGFH